MKRTLSSLDLAEIKQNLINYLKNNTDEFKNYDFSGTGISTLLDLLSYFIHYVGFYLNTTFNELFLETADLRQNVVTIAKSLGYIPYRKKSAKSILHIKFNESIDVDIPSNCKFIGKTKTGSILPFETRNLYSLNSSNGYEADIEIFQQETVEITKTFTNETPYVDLPYGYEIDKIFVFVNNESWDFYDYELTIDYNSKVYFIEELLEGKIRITFGNGIFGKKPSENDEIRVKMYITKGNEGNKIETFELSDIITDSQLNQRDKEDFVVTLISASSGGADEEDIDSIKINAPRMYEVQNRAITKNDYKSILSSLGYLDLISVWGGEELKEPIYGTVFISAKPTGALYLDNIQIQEIKDLIKSKQTVSLKIDVVNPTYIHYDLNVSAYYYQNLGFDTTELSNEIRNSLIEYLTDTTTYFNSVLKYSHLLEAVNEVNGISHNNIEIETYSFIEENPVDSYKIELYNEIDPGTIESYDFVDENGNLILKSDGTKIGTVDYENGILSFTASLNYNDTWANMENGKIVDYKVKYNFVEKNISIKYNTLLNLQHIYISLKGI